jgi:hypothetical protein
VTKPNPIPQELLARLVYDESSPSGLRWRERYNGRIGADLMAGYRTVRGYWHSGYAGKQYRNQRLVWALHHGDPGELVVDHVDGDRGNNRLENLQAITKAQNNARITGRGYAWNKRKRKWHAGMRAGGSPLFLGYFDTEEEARAAYVEAKRARTEGLQVEFPEDGGVAP